MYYVNDHDIHCLCIYAGVANILPQGVRPVAPGTVAATIRPAGIQVRPAANIQPKTPVGIQPKQVCY